MIARSPSTRTCLPVLPVIVPVPERGLQSRPLIVLLAEMNGWWNRYPKEYEAELKDLDSLGIAWTKDESAFQDGCLVVNIQYSLENGQSASLRATYPDTFPYFPPTVELPKLIFPRHQNPTGRHLCLLARDGEDWRPGIDTLAQLIREQLPKIEAVNRRSASPEFIAGEEDHAGEPLSNFLPFHPECQVIVPDDLPPREVHTGRLKLAVRDIPADPEGLPFLGGLVRTITDISGVPLVDFPVQVPAFVKEVSGFWMRLQSRPDLSENKPVADVFLKQMEAAVPAFSRAVQSAKRGQILIAGFTYQDEISWRQQSEDWVFIALRIRSESKGARPAQCDPVFIRADWGGEQSWLSRAPFLKPLRTKSVLVVGLGSLGSSAVLQLAKAGVGNLHLVDLDQLQVGNTLRWALGWRYAGFQKGTALADFIKSQYPYTNVHRRPLRLGSLQEPREYAVVSELLRSADLVIDATASHRVNHFLSDLCREFGKSYLWLTTTHGCSGGVVGRIRPGHTEGCWSCFQRGLDDGTFRLPADWGASEIQPGGCSQPTFIGAGVDSDEIALLAARLAIATLCHGASEGYPDFEWDVAVGDIRGRGVSEFLCSRR